MILNNNIITFPVLSEIDFIKHGFSTRKGGVSEGHLSSMNLSFARGDKTEYVYENYHRICKILDVDPSNLVFTDQVHDTKVQEVSRKHCAGTNLEQKKLIGVDGLITNEPNLVLTTSFADCVPFFFVDVRNKAIGLSHSGWRGTVGKIGKITVESMKQSFGTQPKDLISVIGPSICQACYEVDEDVAREFRKAFTEEITGEILEDKKNGKYQLDLWKANKYILMEAGIPEANISISGICTCCNSDLLFSHRASNGLRGNLNAFLSLK